MLTLHGRAVTALRRRAAALVGTVLLFAPGCALIPTWDDLSAAASTVKDTASGKARRDRQAQAFAEARIMERRQDHAGAERLYRQLLTEEPQSRDCHHRLAVMASVQGKFDEANVLYQKALACGSPSADLWNDVGYCHYLQHQLPEAEGAFKQALALTPQHRSALNNLALVTGEQGNLEESYRLFRQANTEAEAEANFAFLCAQYGDLARAQRHYSRALLSDPEMRSAVDGLFEVTQRLQRLQQSTANNDPNAPQNGVQQASHEAPLHEQQPRRMIEVFTGGPRLTPASNETPAPNATPAPAGTNTTGAAAPTAPPTPSAPPTRPNVLYGNAPTTPTVPATGAPQPQAGGQTPGTTAAAAQPYSFQPQAQPQYLQPSSQPRMAQQGGGPRNESTSPATNGPVLNAGGPFPALVGGASAMR